jgi:hypothetical protein
MSFTWPGGVENVPASPYVMPALDDLNWFTQVNGFLEALGTGAQGTTFQRFSVELVAASPYTVSDTSCVVANSVDARTINLPAGSAKRVLFISNNSAVPITTTITPFAGQTIGGGAPSYALMGAYARVGLIFIGTDWVIF